MGPGLKNSWGLHVGQKKYYLSLFSTFLRHFAFQAGRAVFEGDIFGGFLIWAPPSLIYGPLAV
jgi:hypothetical protein